MKLSAFCFACEGRPAHRVILLLNTGDVRCNRLVAAVADAVALVGGLLWILRARPVLHMARFHVVLSLLAVQGSVAILLMIGSHRD